MIISLISPLRAGALVFFLLMSGGALAHEGHDHADEKVVTAPATLKPRLVARSGPFELVALREDGELLIFLDRFVTNEPVTAAQVTVETPEGSKEANLKDGVYRLPAPWEQNTLDLIFTVVEGPTTEVLAGTLNREAPSPPNAPTGWNLWTPAFAQGLSEKIGSGIPWLLLLFAFAIGVGLGRFLSVPGKSALGLFLAALLVSTPHSTQAHEAGEHGPAKLAMPLSSEMAQRLSDGALFVPKSVQRLLAIRTMVTAASVHHKTLELPGRVIPDPNASGFVQASVSGRISAPQGGFPRLGTSVKAGDVLALVTPPFQAIDVSDMRQKQGELDQQIGIVEKRLARYESLAKTGAVPRVQLDEAILELRGLRDRRSALDKVRAEPEKLIAPVSGVVASTNAAAGKIAEPNSVVFQIIDPARLWVEALTFSLIPSAQSATARTADGGTLTLMFQGAGLTDRSQAIPVQFAIEHAPEGLRVGQLVTVLATTGEEIKGLAIPRASVLRTTNGQTIVFDHAGAERFEPRMVRIEPLDAERVVVLSGLGAGARVVVQGAELLNQIR